MSRLDWDKARPPHKSAGLSTTSEAQHDAMAFVAGYSGTNAFVRRLKGRPLSPAQVRVVLQIRSEESGAWVKAEVEKRRQT